MKCPHCNKDIDESLVMREGMKVAGKRSRRSAGPRCARHGTFVKDGVCALCAIAGDEHLRKTAKKYEDK